MLDSLRAVAAFSVVGYHVLQAQDDRWWSAWTARLNVGVTIFFLLSGFLLYRPFLAGRVGLAPHVRVRRYLRNRTLRIVPAYWVALLVLAAWPGLDGVLSGDWWRYFGFLQAYSADTYLRGIPPAWSLCVEVSFYLALPLIVAGLARLEGARPPAERLRLHAAALVALGVLSVVYRLAAAGTTGAEWLPGTFAWFAMGMLLALGSVAADLHRDGEPAFHRRAAAHPTLWWCAAAALFLLSGPLLGRPAAPGPSAAAETLGMLVLGLVALCLLVPAVFGAERGGLPRRVLALRPLGWLGLVSYGVFLYHEPLLRGLKDAGYETWLPIGAGPTKLVLIPVTVVAAGALSYYLVERPVLSLKGRPGGRRARPDAHDRVGPLEHPA